MWGNYRLPGDCFCFKVLLARKGYRGNWRRRTVVMVSCFSFVFIWERSYFYPYSYLVKLKYFVLGIRNVGTDHIQVY